jgi:REP element-mobilizing transposase RayT
VSNHRALLPDGFFHVYARGIPEHPLYVDDEDRLVFLTLLDRVAADHRLIIHAYCLMTTHYHAVVEAACVELSRCMQRLNGAYARGFNVRHRRFGSLFAERFGTRVIDDETYLRDACAYALLNPVRAGLCDRIEQWPWSYSRYGFDAI